MGSLSAVGSKPTLSCSNSLCHRLGEEYHMLSSGEGTIEGFRQRLIASKQGWLLPQHHDHEHCSEILITSCYSSIPISLSCFAQHEQFPFRLPGHEDGFERVATLLRTCLGKEAEDVFTKAKLLAEQFSTGQSTCFFMIEHFFLECPSVLGRNIKDYGETPCVFGCKMERTSSRWTCYIFGNGNGM